MITVIVVVHNVVEAGENIFDMTRNCITSLCATASQQFELILIDNGSRDYPKTYEFLNELAGVGSEYKLSARVVRNEGNIAISKCWNDTILQTSGEQIFLVNNDIVFHRKGWMTVVLDSLHRSNVGAVGLQGMSWNGFTFIEGAFFCFNRGLVGQLAGPEGRMFDEQFIFSCEDADVCRRMQNIGMMTLQEPSLYSYMVHEHHGTLSYVDREGGMIPGRPIQYTTHDMRRLLCRKYGMPEAIVD